MKTAWKHLTDRFCIIIPTQIFANFVNLRPMEWGKAMNYRLPINNFSPTSWQPDNHFLQHKRNNANNNREESCKLSEILLFLFANKPVCSCLLVLKQGVVTLIKNYKFFCLKPTMTTKWRRFVAQKSSKKLRICWNFAWKY